MHTHSFGSLVLLESSGVIFNNEMNDFAIPGENCSTCLPDDQPNNGIQGGKRAQSSMSPSILTDAEGKVRMVVGAAGGTKIITVVAQVCDACTEKERTAFMFHVLCMQELS